MATHYDAIERVSRRVSGGSSGLWGFSPASGAAKRSLEGMVGVRDRRSQRREAPSAVEPRGRPAEPPRIAFLLSAERSGSTLLSMCLGANPAVVAPPEMHLLAYSSFDEWQRDYGEAYESLRYLLGELGLGMEDHVVQRLFGGRTTSWVYSWILENGFRERRTLLDKTPRYSRSADSLARLETFRPHYIWLVRHPLAVAVSQIELREQRRLARSTGLVRTLRKSLHAVERRFSLHRAIDTELAYWRSVNRNIEFFLAGVDSERQIVVNFESFVRSPETCLAELCNWLGADFVPDMLSPSENLPAGLGPKTGDPKIHRTRGIEASTADRWRETCPPGWIDPQTLALARRWGVEELSE